MLRNIFVSLLSKLLKGYFLEATTSLTQGVIDIVERVVHAEVLKMKAKELVDATPQRPPRKPKTKIKVDKVAQ